MANCAYFCNFTGNSSYKDKTRLNAGISTDWPLYYSHID